MRYAVIGGGMRFAHLAEMLNEEGSQAQGFFQEKAGGEKVSAREIGKYSAIISNWPMRFPLAEDEIDPQTVMDQIESGSVLLLCGPKFPSERRWDLQYVNLWADETLLCENAYITAQGAAAAALKRKKVSFVGAKCAVVGYGRIGRALCEILLGAGAEVTLLSDTASKRRRAIESGAQAAEIAAAMRILPNCQYIFSTPPAHILNADVLSVVRKDALLMDLASPPYGFELEAALRMGLDACCEPGLPDRYCPLSAARVLYHAIRRWEHENHG